VRNLPFFIFKDIKKRIASIDFGTITTHCDFVDTYVLSPVAASDNVTLENHNLGLLFEELVEVVGD